MAREFTLTERNTAKAAHVWHLSRAEVLDVDDTWQDLSDLGPDSINTFLGGTLTRTLDANVWQAVVRVRLSYDEEGLSPLVAASVFNRDGVNAYAPLLHPGRRIRLYAQTLLPSDDPEEIDERLMFEGRIDRPQFTNDPMTLTCRDLGGKLIDTIIRRRVTYGDKDNPVPAHEVIQQILTDAADLIGETITLVVPEEPEFVITERTIENISVMDAIHGVATLFGWVVTYRFQSDGTFKLTLYDPLRDKDTPDYTLEPTEYLTVDDAALDFTGGRNYLRVWFTDGVTGEPLSVDAFDTGSIATFGEQFMQLGGEQLAGITNGNDAAALAAAALADLSTPLFDHAVTNTFTWFAEIGDYVAFTGNAVHYDEDQALGLVSIVHEFPDGGSSAATTKFQCRGKPAGAYKRWLKLQGGPVVPLVPPAPELMFALPEATQFGGTTATVDGGLWIGYKMPVGVDEIRIHSVLGDGANLSVPAIDASSYAMTVRRPEGDIGSIDTLSGRGYPGQPGEYASLVLLSTRSTGPATWKRVSIVGVRGGLTSPPVVTPSREMIDPSPSRVDGTIASITVARDGDTNTVTVTPGTLESTDDTVNGNWVVLIRNSNYLPPIYVKDSLDPVVFVDSGLPEDDSYEAVYEAFIWNGGQSGPKRRYASGVPTLAAPAWALGTPSPAINLGLAKIQLSWTASTPGATGVRVEASLDGVTARTVGSGAVASGTVYDLDTGAKRYRLVAFDGSGDLIATPWRWNTQFPPTISNPSALPQFVKGTPKPAIYSAFPGLDIRLAISWSCKTAGARQLRIQESTDNGVGDAWSTMPNSTTASVSAGTWYSPDSTAVPTDMWYRLQALDIDGNVIASSAGTHYIPPAA